MNKFVGTIMFRIIHSPLTFTNTHTSEPDQTDNTKNPHTFEIMQRTKGKVASQPTRERSLLLILSRYI